MFLSEEGAYRVMKGKHVQGGSRRLSGSKIDKDRILDMKHLLGMD